MEYTAIDNQASFCFVLPLEKELWSGVFYVFDHDVSRLQWCVGVGSCADVEAGWRLPAPLQKKVESG